MNDRVLTTYGVASRLVITEADVVRLVDEHSLPAIVLPNGELRFRNSDVADWIASHRRPPLVQHAPVTREGSE